MRVEPRASRAPWRPALAAAWSCAVLACAPACGEDVLLGAGRARPDAADSPDAGKDAGPAVPAFSEPVAIAAISADGASDDDPSLTEDLTLMYFNSERDGGAGEEDIWLSARASREAEWQPPAPEVRLNSERRETGIALAPDGLAIFWSSDREGGAGGLDVYTATRASRSEPWSEPARVAELSSEGDDLVSALGDGGRLLLLARRDDGDDDYDLYRAERPAPGQPFAEPLPIAELNGDDEESDAFPIASGEQLLFTRDGDLQFARRGAQGTFTTPAPLASLNSEDDDRDPWATPDLSYVVFSSDREGDHRLYEATR